jgi:hypothetical protein
MAVAFVYGESPFRAKGITYTEALHYYDGEIQGGRGALLGALQKETQGRAGKFFEQPFVVGGWYDALPLIDLHRAAAGLLGRPYLEVLKDLARWQMPRQIHGVYRFFLKLSSPERVIENLPKTAKQYYDFIEVSVKKLGPKAYETRARGLPEEFAPGYMAATEVSILVALDIAGARGAQHRWKMREPDGERAGVKLVSVGREIRWG